MAWIAVGMGTLAVGASMESNRAISKTANANANATAANLLQNTQVTQSQLQDKASQVNNQLGMELTNLVYQSLAAKGQTTAATAERNITGNTAMRTQESVAMKKALAEDTMIQATESKLLDVQNEMRNAKYSYESGMMSNTINFNNTMSQQTGTLGMISAGVSGAASGYSMGNTAGLYDN